MTGSRNSSLRKAALVLVAAFWLAAFSSAAYAQPAAPEGRQPIDPAKPRLQVAIPGVELTPASVKDGMITVGFVAQYVAGLYAFLVGVVGVVAAVAMIAGGFFYLTAGGNPDGVKRGKKMIANALIGMVLALGSYTILWTVNPALLQFKALQFEFVRTDIDEDFVVYGTDGVTAEAAPSEESMDATKDAGTEAQGNYRDRAWDSCGDHQGLSLGTEDERRKRLVDIVKTWKEVGVDEGGSLYVRGGNFRCKGNDSGQVDFVANHLKQSDEPLVKVTTPVCKTYIETWRNYLRLKKGTDSAATERALADANAATEAFTLGKGGFPITNDPDKPSKSCKGTPAPDECKCHYEFQQEYARLNGNRAKDAGLICGDCGTTMASLYECFDKTKAAKNIVQQLVPSIVKGKGLPGCKHNAWLEKGGKTYKVDEADYVIRLDIASKDETKYTVRLGAGEPTEITNDPKTNKELVAEMKKHIKFGDVLSITAPGPAHDNDGARHVFMYTGGAGLDFETLEMGQVGGGDRGQGSVKARKILGITTGKVGAMAAGSTLEAYFAKLGKSHGYNPLVCVWVRRPYANNRSGF